MTKQINVGIIGQGRSGRDIHGVYLCKDDHFKIVAVADALAERRQVQILYATASRQGDVHPRVVEPYTLLPYGRSWYLIAFGDLSTRSANSVYITWCFSETARTNCTTNLVCI